MALKITLNSSLIACILLAVTTDADNDQYKIGTGIADITGPAAEINMVSFQSIMPSSINFHVAFQDGIRDVESELGRHTPQALQPSGDCSGQQW